MTLWRITAVATCISALTSASLSAQVTTTPAIPPITSNRPGIGDSEALVGRAVVQLELGIESDVTTLNDEHSWTTGWGQSTLRVGIVDPVEIFVSWGGWSVDRIAETGSTRIEAGGNDLLVGAKFAILDESRHGLTLTVQPFTSVPIGGDDFSSHSYDGALRLLWARSLGEKWDLSGNVLFLSTTDDSGRYWDNVVTTCISRDISPSSFLFAELATGLTEPRAWTLDGGVAWVPRPNVQWDLSSGVLVRGPGQSWFVSAGITLRHLPRRFRAGS
jgi:hypothetical protein